MSYSSLHPLPCLPQKRANIQWTPVNSIIRTTSLRVSSGPGPRSGLGEQWRWAFLLHLPRLRWSSGWQSGFVLGWHVNMPSLVWHENWPIRVDPKSSGGPCSACLMPCGCWTIGPRGGGWWAAGAAGEPWEAQGKAIGTFPDCNNQKTLHIHSSRNLPAPCSMITEYSIVFPKNVLLIPISKSQFKSTDTWHTYRMPSTQKCLRGQ